MPVQCVINNPHKGALKIIKLFKCGLRNLGRYIKPAWEIIACLVKNESEFIAQKNNKHYYELQDNIYQTVELLEYYREILNDELNVYHSSMSTRLNDIKALLTIFSVIFIPFTFIVGVYGMNFDNIPELHLSNGYYIIWGVML